MKSFTEHIGRHRTRFPPSHGESITLRTRRNETASRVTAAHAPRAQHPSPHGNKNAHTDRDHPKAETQKTKEMDRTSKRPPPSSLSLPSPLAAIVGGCFFASSSSSLLLDSASSSPLSESLSVAVAAAGSAFPSAGASDFDFSLSATSASSEESVGC